MSEMLQANWILLVVALLLGVLVAWRVFAASRRTTINREEDRPEASASTARRNQALIDAAPAAAARPDVAAPVPEPAPEPAKPATPQPLAAAQPASEPEPAPEPQPAPATPAVADSTAPAPAAQPVTGDELTRIKGVGPKLAQQLRDLNVTGFSQIAGWTDADIDRIDPQLGRFQGRIRRDNWVEQARLLAAGDTASYEARFGKL